MDKFIASARIAVPPFTLDLHREHPSIVPSLYFVKHSPGNFAAMNIGPASYFLSREQVRHIAEQANDVLARFAAAEDGGAAESGMAERSALIGAEARSSYSE